MAAKKKNTGLGKGLEALFGDLENQEKEEQAEVLAVEKVSIDAIRPNKAQPRKSFNQETIDELASSIEEHGILQPIIVRTVENGYEIVAGERRYRAARAVGIKEVPCIIRELTDEENMLFAIIENMQREDLNPIEEAEGIGRMISTFHLTQEQVSKSVGKSRPYITNALRLLKLPESIRDQIIEGALSAGHGRALLSLEDEEKMIQLAELVIKQGLSVRGLEELIAGKRERRKPREIVKNPDVLAVEEDLKRTLGTRVNIKQSGKNGKIEIEYYNRDDLERLIEMLRSI
ncbi:MAG: ParB/RepB/Spo0J family partition protein [Anaerovoracaceae bacterium]